VSEEPQPRVVAKLEIDRGDYIHNDLANAAFHLLEKVRAAQKEDRREGVGLEIMAAITMTAFAFEAYVNFVGASVLKKDWLERDPTPKKRKTIAEALKIEWDESTRPFSTVKELQDVRSILAHGKPHRTKKDWRSVGTHDELQMELRSFVPDWKAKVISYDFLERAFEDVEAVWRLMLDKAGIAPFDTMSGGTSGMEFLGRAGDNQPPD
jgi:hypothetical protein